MNDVAEKIRRIRFEEALEFWSATLWTERKTSIEPTSAMLFLGGYDVTIACRFEPSFFGIFEGGELVAINSGHRTSTEHYRARGLFVAERVRGRGYARGLFSALAEQAREERANVLWSYPRESAFCAYAAFGFTQASPWQRDNDTPEEQHCFAACVLTDLTSR